LKTQFREETAANPAIFGGLSMVYDDHCIEDSRKRHGLSKLFEVLINRRLPLHEYFGLAKP
jgi:hypothetical protein